MFENCATSWEYKLKMVDLLATAGDFPLSWTSPIYPKLYSNDSSVNPLGKPITEHQDAWIGSLVTIGAIIGPLLFGCISQKFGRKISLLSIAIPHIISFVTLAFAKNIYLFYFARILSGVAMGGGYTMIPMYIAEISQNSNRGMMSQTMNVFWAIGNFIPYAVGPYTSIMWFNIILACIPIVFFFIFFLVGPESPYYLVSVNKIKKAEKSLMVLRSLNEKGVEIELEMIKEHLEKEETGRFSDIFKSKGLRKAFTICLVLVVAQELSGFCAITFYLQPIFEAVGTKIGSDISAIIVGLAMLFSSFFAPFLVDRAGRKILTIYSCFGMFLSLTLIAIYFYLQDSTKMSTEPIYWIPIFSLIFYIFSFNFGICTVPWTLTSELFPNKFKQLSASTISCVCWITSFIITKFFNDMNDYMGRAGTFGFFAGSCLATAIFSIFCVPETKGKSFGEIQDMLNFRNVEKETNVGEIQGMLNNDNK